MTIAEVSKKYGISPDTLRYYERVGLIPAVPRKSGIRHYDDESCRWIELMICMRKAGVQIEALIEYVSLFVQGDATLDERLELLKNQRQKLEEKKIDIESSIVRLNKKIDLYERGEMTEEKRRLRQNKGI